MKIFLTICTKQNNSPRATNKKVQKKNCASAAPSSNYGLSPRIALWELIYGRSRYWDCIWDYIKMKKIRKEKDHKWRKRIIVWRKIRKKRMDNQDKYHQKKNITII